MNDVENLKNNINFINDFATELFGKTTQLSVKTIESINKLSNLIEIEKKNETFLQGVSESISDEQLQKTKASLESHLKDISEKQSEYMNLINKNSKSIIQISSDIRSKKEILDQVYEMCDKLEKLASFTK